MVAKSDDDVPVAGTPYYLAPEVVPGSTPTPGGVKITEKIDVWALGVIMYELFMGDMPFSGENFDELYDNIRKGEYSLPDDFPEQVKDLLSNML